MQQWLKGKERSLKMYALKKDQRVRLRIDLGCSVIDHECVVSKAYKSGSVDLQADSEFNQCYHIAADGWIVLNSESGLKRQALVTRLSSK